MIQAGDFRIQQSNAERNIANFLTFLVSEKKLRIFTHSLNESL